MAYIRAVKSNKHITITRKITAMFFIGLMLFVNAVQFFHSHPSSFRYSLNAKSHSSLKPGFEMPTFAQNDHCPICDFRSTKDAEPSKIFSDLTPFSGSTINFIKLLPLDVSTIHSISPGRAPPAFI